MSEIDASWAELTRIIKTLNSAWKEVSNIKHLSDVTTSRHLPHAIGLYKFSINDEIVYIGRAIEKGKGLAKRIFDYTRKSDSARLFIPGFLANKHCRHVSVQVFECDSKVKTCALEQLFIAVLMPTWNTKLNDWLTRHPEDNFVKEQIKARKVAIKNITKKR